MKKIITLHISILFSFTINAQIEPASELETNPIIQTQLFPDYSSSDDKKHLYIIFEKNKNSKIDSVGRKGNQKFIVFYLLKEIPEEEYLYRIRYDTNANLIKAIPGTLSWGNEGRIIFGFHPKINKHKIITVSDNFKKKNNILNTNEIKKIQFKTLRKVVEMTDIIDILIKTANSKNKYKLYRVRNRKK